MERFPRRRQWPEGGSAIVRPPVGNPTMPLVLFPLAPIGVLPGIRLHRRISLRGSTDCAASSGLLPV
jgi:hypothetical protein